MAPGAQLLEEEGDPAHYPESWGTEPGPGPGRRSRGRGGHRQLEGLRRP